MRYPNIRYGNPTEFRHYAEWIPKKHLAKLLRKSERTINDWTTEKQRIPFWVPELLRLRELEQQQQMRRMGIQQDKRKERKSLTTANDALFKQTSTSKAALRVVLNIGNGRT